MDRTLALAICGVCDAELEAPEPPETCSECNAMFVMGEPFALLWLTFSQAPSVGWDLELCGAWDSNAAADLRRSMFHVV